MLTRIALLVCICVSCLPFVGKVQAQENSAETGKPEEVPAYYDQAFLKIKAMLEGKQPISFKKAVLITENAYFENTLDTLQVDAQIRWYALLCKLYQQANPMIAYNFKDREEVSLHGAVFKVLTDTVDAIILQEKVYHLPFTYDFDDFFGDVSWSQTFVSKLLKTKKGNCHSLPYLYKILCEELGVSAHLALAPNHLYIKHKSEKTGWYNTELTSASFPIDAWLMASGYIRLPAIQHKTYMDTLSMQQSIALCLTDLANGYMKKYPFANNDFVLKCTSVVRKYYPHCINALLLESETYGKQYQYLLKYGKEKSVEGQNIMNSLKQVLKKIHDIGYRRMPPKMYFDWLLELRNHPQKYQNAAFKD
jgi:hypothetical protein